MTKNVAKFSVKSSGSYEVFDTNAKTLRGAKMIASRMFNQTINGEIVVMENIHHDTDIGDYVEHYEVSIKYGFDKNWTDIH